MRNFVRKSPLGIITLAVIASVSACTTATPYQPYIPELAAGVHGGYSERELAPDRYAVRFHGNELTSRDRVEGYLLYRAAELTLQKGFDWFTIIDRHTEHDVRTYVGPSSSHLPYYGPGYDYWRPHWRYYSKYNGWNAWHPEYGDPFWADRIDIQSIESFEAEAEIVMNKGLVTAGQERAFDARKVIADLGPTIVRPAK